MAEKDNAVQQYEIFYKEISENATTVDIFGGNENLNVTKGASTAVVDGLETGKKHQFFVIARNQGFLRLDQTFSAIFTHLYLVELKSDKTFLQDSKSAEFVILILLEHPSLMDLASSTI